MGTGNEWERYFDEHAPCYMENVFTRHTAAEIDFLVDELGFAPGSRVLDVGCGTGRHSVALAARGFVMTGVDLSAGMLEQARLAAVEAGVEVTWVRADVAESVPQGPFDAALCLCEGAFGLLGASDSPDDHESRILRNINRALRPSSRLVLTASNGMALVRRFTDQDVSAGRFDPHTMVEAYELEYDTPRGRRKIPVREKAFTPSELALLLRDAGFEVEHIWGGTAGNWGRRKVQLDEIEIMVVARKCTDVA